MATIFQVLYLGKLASIDVIENDGVNERASDILGSYGSASQPLRNQVQIFSRVESATGSNRDAYDYENANDRFSINGGSSQTYDGAVLYDAVLTYSDGTTAKIRVPVFQDDIGNTYVAPPLASDPATLAALQAQPIQSIKLTQVVNSVGVMSADRATPDYISPVDGTSSDDFMSDGYTDAQGDQVGSGDDYILAGDGKDTIYGGNGQDKVYGGAGDDYIDGGAGNDTIFGGDGSDTLVGGAGNDTLAGGAGTDKAVFIGPVTEYSFDYGSSGALIVTDSVPDRDGTDTISGFEYVEFNGVTYHLVTGDDGSNTTLQGPGDGTPSIIIAHDGNDWGGGHATSDVIFGGAGDDTLDGGDGDDTLLGEDGNDLLRGDGGNDSLIGGAGADTLAGGAGNDTLAGGAGTDKAVFIGPVTEYSFDYGPSGALIVTDSVPDRDGTDTISGFEYVEFNGVTYHLVTGDDGSNTTLQGPGDGTPSIIIAHDGNDWGGGHATSDVIFGGAGDDTLDGGDGDDTLLGEDGNDLLRGDGGNDSLIGGAGADTLAGGAGNDTLAGGTGDDVFFYAAGDGADTIIDFNSGNSGTLGDGDSTNNDFIDLSGFYDGLSELRADFADDGILNQSNTIDLSGNAVDYSDNEKFGSGDSLTFQNANRNSFTTDNTGVVCFASGTLILTPSGELPIEYLRPGDLVVTKDNGPQPLLWSGMRRLGAMELGQMPHLKPIEIKPGAFGNHSVLVVSPQHGVLVNYDNNETMVRAKHLAEMRGGVRIKIGCRCVTYCHLLFEKHEVIFSNGLPSESFFPGPEAIKTLDGSAYDELITLLPSLSRELDKNGILRSYGPTAREFSPRKELPAEISALRQC